jgi:hypothetical protein
VGAELFHADRRADRDMTKLIVAFRHIANVPENAWFIAELRLAQHSVHVTKLGTFISQFLCAINECHCCSIILFFILCFEFVILLFFYQQYLLPISVFALWNKMQTSLFSDIAL